jgi:hypothetical protein
MLGPGIAPDSGCEYMRIKMKLLYDPVGAEKAENPR